MIKEFPHHPARRRELWRRYRDVASHQEFRVSVLFSALLFFGSVVVSFFAIQYATERASNPVTDIVLSNTPVLDVGGLFVFSTLLLIAFILLLLLAHPKRIPFTLHAMALFFLVRSVFITLTHIGPFPIPAENTYDLGTLISRFLFSSDLFFSAHTGIPFLLALVFWRERNLRNIFLGWSVFMGGLVLLGHYHYTIDVASAFFITYSVFHVAEWLFPKDRALFHSNIPSET